MEPPASSRPSSDSASPTHGPIPLYDVHLRYLNDSYISFFQERKRIEEVYTESLLRLHRKMKSVDAYLDERADVTTLRSAWGDFRDNTEREAQARQAFLQIISDEIIRPLASFKDTQERTRKRIKEDLRDSGIAYNEYAEVTLPKLQSRYGKRFMEVEEQRKIGATGPMSPPILPPDATFTNIKPHPNPAHAQQHRPTVTAPQPLRPVDRRPSTSGPGGRNRSPSSTTAFSDLAHQGKRQLNTLIGFLDKGGSVKDGGSQNNTALRTVRAKRDLDEADKEYRKGVHWLESLRLRRTKTLESGYKSLTMFVDETSALMKQVLEKFTDNMTATATTEAQLFSHARGIINRISPERDVAKLSISIPTSLASAIPDPILYFHGVVGECNDLIFGFSLVDYAVDKNLPEGKVPRIIDLCINDIDRRGLESEGIYRVSGRHANVQALQHAIEKDEGSFMFHPQTDIYCVASLLKQYLRELPEPVFKYTLQDRIQHTADLNEHITNNFAVLRSKMKRLPPVHYATLKALVLHLARVNSHREKNKMDCKNLAIVFGSVIFGEDDLPKPGDLLSMQNWKDTLMEDLITHAHALFDDNGSPSSPPLPPTPAGEPIPAYTYGSKTTRVANLMLGNQNPNQEDFTPRLPPRPTSSIHPSARANPPPSPVKERTDLSVRPAPPSSSSSSPDRESPVSHTSVFHPVAVPDEVPIPPTPSAVPFPSKPVPPTPLEGEGTPRRASGRFD